MRSPQVALGKILVCDCSQDWLFSRPWWPDLICSLHPLRFRFSASAPQGNPRIPPTDLGSQSESHAPWYFVVRRNYLSTSKIQPRVGDR